MFSQNPGSALLQPESKKCKIQVEEDAEKSISNKPIQMEEKNPSEANSIPLDQEQEPLGEDFQVSCKLEERTNENNKKHVSTVPCPSSSFVLNLTEMVNMWNDENDEVNCIGKSSPMDTVEGYKVKRDSMPIMICDIVSELQGNDFNQIKENELHNMIALANEIKDMKVNIQRLYLRLQKILEAKQVYQRSVLLKEKKNNKQRFIETMEKKMEECEAEKIVVAAKFPSPCDKETSYKETIARVGEESIRIVATIRCTTSKIRHFLNCSLVDDLLNSKERNG
ncbi:hypothetical protein RJT34_03402 [Clitoria ternatea]|uniref:Uncharacterized protein n=1 Tax=Clitoria ternatea TaxID=43366 RepID=A0AAN9Q175_CLITE